MNGGWCNAVFDRSVSSIISVDPKKFLRYRSQQDRKNAKNDSNILWTQERHTEIAKRTLAVFLYLYQGRRTVSLVIDDQQVCKQCVVPKAEQLPAILDGQEYTGIAMFGQIVRKTPLASRSNGWLMACRSAPHGRDRQPELIQK